jgi:hypothetical protein
MICHASLAADLAQFMEEKTQEAAAAPIERLSTDFDRSAGKPVRGIGNAWSRTHFDGDFNLYVPPDGGTALSLVFVQSKNGNTGAKDPSALGGGPTDEHLIYEGLSRVAADAVLAGAGSVPRRSLFSVWHPELVALRASLGLARHPAQIVVSKEGRGLDFTSLVFNVPDVPVFLSRATPVVRHTPRLRDRTGSGVPIEGGNTRTAPKACRE